jgi:hypothetical protein
MSKAPRMGAAWSQLWRISAKLADDTPLEGSDRRWLLELLQSAAVGEDVSKRFTKNKKPSPEAERHFWIALDVAQHIHDRRAPAHDLVAQRWGLTDADTARKIAQRQRENTAPLGSMLGDGLAAVIDMHRERLGHKSL